MDVSVKIKLNWFGGPIPHNLVQMSIHGFCLMCLYVKNFVNSKEELPAIKLVESQWNLLVCVMQELQWLIKQFRTSVDHREILNYTTQAAGFYLISQLHYCFLNVNSCIKHTVLVQWPCCSTYTIGFTVRKSEC